ncbi:MAG: LPS-assembly protein LptD [Fimbriimonadaceae bacterium]
MRRAAGVIACLLVSAVASAQFSSSLGGAFRALRYYGLYPSPPLTNPLDAKGFNPKLPSRIPTPPQEPDVSGDLVVRRSGHATGGAGLVHLEGGFLAEYKGYTMAGDVLDGNRHSEVYIISGNAKLTGPDAVVTARRIMVDYNSRTYEAFDSESELRPSLVGGVLQTDVYTRARRGSGSEAEQYIDHGLVTTCNYPDPHYYLDARYTDLRFRHRIVFHDLGVWVLGHHLFNLPFLSVPLDNRDYNNLPTVGQNSYEGYFIKTNYGIPLKGDRALYTRFDYMTKLGVGAGFDYKATRQTGLSPYTSELTVYGVTGAQMLDITQSHDQTFKWGRVQMQNTYTGHDYLTAPDSNILNSRLSVMLKQRYGSTGLNYNRSSNTGPGFNSLTQTFGFTNSESVASRFRENTQVTYTDSANTFANGTANTSIDRKQIDINFEADEDLKKAAAMVQYQRTVPVGQIQNFVGGTDRTPVISLSTDSNRLFGQGVGRAFPLKTIASIGQFGDPQSGADITRDRLDMSFDKASNPQKRASFDVQGMFAQSFYSDNTAQYVVGTSDTFTYRLGKDTSLNARYNYNRPEGYTPLGIDQSGMSNLLSEDISVRPARPLLVGAQSSYDFVQRQEGSVGWSPVGLRVEYNPHDYLLLRGLATYDPFFKGVANYRLDATYRPGATLVGLGARYDNTRSTWAEIDLYLSSLKWGRVKTDLRMSYNGYSKQFNSIQASLIYDLHCAEAVAQIVDNPIGFQSGTSFLFFIRIKGLPFGTSFGNGTRGQPFGYGTGIGY